MKKLSLLTAARENIWQFSKQGAITSSEATPEKLQTNQF
jgi:hypothetical protein